MLNFFLKAYGFLECAMQHGIPRIFPENRNYSEDKDNHGVFAPDYSTNKSMWLGYGSIRSMV
ncbi:hypothetical protein BDA96_10G190400 [Sorghum bicolor]|uniref:Uncharacterized protein n=2 Tax=Sorghum bicolor TaxID=4558 RepID=A0A921Q4X5_SORBI|nr:hypothetical protein BDA96_10G190400 [Sorghum bicolor]OQU76445.1 hypothetical protein SORBI_3010G145650 [Sorghum bicolor]